MASAVNETRLAQMKEQIRAAGKKYYQFPEDVLDGQAYPFLEEFAQLVLWDPPTFENKIITNWFNESMPDVEIDPILTKHQMKHADWQVLVKAGPYECFGEHVYLHSNFRIAF